MTNPYKVLSTAVILILHLSLHPAVAQTWEQVFAKAEKKYAKGKYEKVEKKIAKLRKKRIAKKYKNEPSIFALTYLMQAKADEALARYDKMEANLIKGLKDLSQFQDSTYNYVVGHLRAVDLYNDYGNHEKAGNLLAILDRKLPEGSGSLVLDLEIEMRKTFTQIEKGFFNKSKTTIDSVVLLWPKLMKRPYYQEEITSRDKFYRDQILARLYTAEVEILRLKGEFKKASEVIEVRNKQLNRLVGNTTPGYINFKITELNTAMDWSDLKTVEKTSKRLVSVSPPGRLNEDVADATVRAFTELEYYESAKSARDKADKALSKSNVERDYRKYKKKFLDLIIDSRGKEVKKNLLPKFLKNEDLAFLPTDHKLITENYQEAIRYLLHSGRSESYMALGGLYKGLENSLDLRYGKASLPYRLFKVGLAGYFLKYSEEPSKAFSLLEDKPYEMIIEEISPLHPDYQQTVENITEYFTTIGQFGYPISLMKNIVQSVSDNPNASKDELGEKMVNLARLQIQAGYYKEAETNVDEALKLIRRGGERKSEKYIEALNSAAYLYGTIGLYNKAEKLLKRSESIYGKIGSSNRELKLKSIVDLAFLYTRIGKYSETEDLLKEVIKARTKTYGPQGKLLIKPYIALGSLYRISGDYTQSEEYLRKALYITEKKYSDTTLIFTEDLSQLVKLYIDLGNYESALVNATEVLKIRKKVLREDHVLFADTYNDLGHIHYNLNTDISTVEKYYTLALNITKANFDENHPLYAESLKNLAFVHIKRKDFANALKNLNAADEIWRNALANRNRSSGEVARLKGDIYSFIGKFKEARSEYEKAARYFRKIFSEEHPDYLNTQSRLARSYFINEELSNVESVLSETTASYLNYTKNYFSTLSEDEKAKFWNKIKADFEFYNTVAVAYKSDKPKYLENMYNFALATKGLLLNSSIKTRNSILNSGDTVLINLFKKWTSKKEYLTSTLAQTEEELEENGVDVQDLKGEIELLEKILSEKSEAFTTSFEYKFYSWDDVRKALKDDEAAIEIIRYREFDNQFNEEKIRYAALIVTAETKKNPLVVILENGKDLETTHFKYQRNATKYKLRDDKSYEVYWKPIHDVIRDKSTVFLSPDGVYNQINIEALLLGDEEYVIDRQNVRIIGNTKTIAAYRSKEAQKEREKEMQESKTFHTALLVGNPTYYASAVTQQKAREDLSRSGGGKYVPQLPGTEKEVKAITSLLEEKGWKIESHIGTDATETEIKKAKDYTLIHIATHGFFDDHPLPNHDTKTFTMDDDDNPLERSGLLAKNGGEVLLKATSNYNIDDGVLTAREAMNLNFDKTELIVLSACETGRGEIQQGEGVFGLQRSFLVAGADAIIMSLFQVSDEVTQKLMVQFYTNWINGQDKRSAFNNAQKEIKQTYKEPIYWGAFTMIGKI